MCQLFAKDNLDPEVDGLTVGWFVHSVITNNEDVEIELKKIFGAFKDASTEKFIRNVSPVNRRSVESGLICRSRPLLQHTKPLYLLSRIGPSHMRSIASMLPAPHSFYS
jgi:hypothetical protein